MALIKCPECGNEISDKAIKCPRCGYPLKGEEIKIVQEHKNDNEGSAEDSVIVDEKQETGKKKIGVCIGGILFLLVAFAGVFTVKNNQPITVDEMNICKWKLTDNGKYYDQYEGYIESTQTKPFVAAIGNYEDKDDKPNFYVYVENGKGVFDTIESDDDDPSIKYLPIGYLSGKVMNESDIAKVNYNDRDYSDYDYTEKTACTIDIDVEIKEKGNGVLFAQIENDLNNKIERNVPISIINGKGDYSYYLSDLPLKSRGVTIKLTPKMFCKATFVKNDDYTVEEPFEVKKDEEDSSAYVSYDGKEELSFKNYEDGLLLYTEKLVDGGETEKRDKVYNRMAAISQNKCKIITSVFAKKEDKILMPSYEINKIGYVEIEKYNKSQKETY